MSGLRDLPEREPFTETVWASYVARRRWKSAREARIGVPRTRMRYFLATQGKVSYITGGFDMQMVPSDASQTAAEADGTDTSTDERDIGEQIGEWRRIKRMNS